jgi:uncharacterized pyridoxamine 5'-phosphate oxidase family protein
MKQYYPKEYTSILIFLTEYGIFAYSFIELKTKKMYKQIKNNSSVNSLLEQIKSPNNIGVILNNQSVNDLSKESIYSNLPFENNFIIYSESEPMTSKTNKIIIHNFSESTPIDVFKYKLCNYMFISTVLYLERKSLIVNYDLKLFCNGDNYFVANNKIDKYVICYLLKKQKNVYFIPENIKYKFNIIDQNANVLELSEKDVLYLHENNYEILQEDDENENSTSSVGSKEYEIVENDNN